MEFYKDEWSKMFPVCEFQDPLCDCESNKTTCNQILNQWMNICASPMTITTTICLLCPIIIVTCTYLFHTVNNITIMGQE